MKFSFLVPIKPPERVICTPNQSGRSVEISWEPPSSGEQMDHISGYTVYLQQHSDEREEEVKDTSVGSSVCRTVLEDLRPSTKYKIWISARSKNGHGPPSETKVIDTTVRKCKYAPKFKLSSTKFAYICPVGNLVTKYHLSLLTQKS